MRALMTLNAKVSMSGPQSRRRILGFIFVLLPLLIQRVNLVPYMKNLDVSKVTNLNGPILDTKRFILR